MIHHAFFADVTPNVTPSGLPGWYTIVGALGGAVISGAVALLIWWLNRKRGQYVIVAEEGRDSLVRIAERVRKRITTTLDGKTVASLSQIAVRITNSGLEVLNGIELCFGFGPATKVLEAEVTPASQAQMQPTRFIGPKADHPLPQFITAPC